MQTETKQPQQGQAPGHLLFLESWVGVAGAGITIVGLMLAVLMSYFSFVHKQIAYLALFYLAVGGIFALGLTLVAVGALRARKRRQLGKHNEPHLLISLDLSKPAHQTTALVAIVLTVIGMGAVTSGTYFTVHWAESDQFCTYACHSVMKPEGTAHLTSEHANVKCVDCHVGEGAGGFFEAKVNGIRQLVGVATGDFNRPIETPIHNMKAAEEVCEGCHWRDRYIGHKVKSFTYFSAKDEENTKRTMRMLINVGGAKQSGGEGIHNHMLGRKVEFIARDHKRQQVAWVKVTEPDGTVKEWNHSEKPLGDDEKKSLPARTMDCLDCHNRPAHQFRAPMNAMNEAMEAGKISAAIPNIKLKGVQVLSVDYATTEEAVRRIAEDLKAYYEEEFPEVLEDDAAAYNQAVAGVQKIYLENMFPEMKARWAVYPENDGHRDSPGCFRCHNDQLVNEDDEPIFVDCKGCHIVLTQGSEIANVQEDVTQGLAFFHPDDEDYIKEYNDCGECHTGGADTYDE